MKIPLSNQTPSSENTSEKRPSCENDKIDLTFVGDKNHIKTVANSSYNMSNKLDKQKKRKIKQEKTDEPQKKKKKKHNSIEYVTQDIFQQANLEEFSSSTPNTARKKVKKKHEKKYDNVNSQNGKRLFNGVESRILNEDINKLDPSELIKDINSSDKLKNGHVDPYTQLNNYSANKKSDKEIHYSENNDNAINNVEKNSYTNGDGTLIGVKKIKKKKKKRKQSNSVLGELLRNLYPTTDSASPPEFNGVHRHKKKKMKVKSSSSSKAVIIVDSSSVTEEEEPYNVSKMNDVGTNNKCDNEPIKKKKIPSNDSSIIPICDLENSVEEIRTNSLKNGDIALIEPTIEKKKKKHIELTGSLSTNSNANFSTEFNGAKKHKKKKSKESSCLLTSKQEVAKNLPSSSVDVDLNSSCNSILIEVNGINKHKKNKCTESSSCSSALKQEVDKNVSSSSVDAYLSSTCDSISVEVNDNKHEMKKYTESSSWLSALKQEVDKDLSRSSSVNSARGSVSSEFQQVKKHKKKCQESDSILLSSKEDNASSYNSDTKLDIFNSSLTISEHSLSKSDLQKCEDVCNNSSSSNQSNGNQAFFDVHDKEDKSSSDDEELIEESKPKFRMLLKDMVFNVDFEVPALHKIVNRVSKPSLDQRAQIAIEGIQIKFGRFTKAEDKQIRENWKYFVESNGLEDRPELFFQLDKRYIPAEAKKSFLYYLARAMPERTPYSVFRRFKILMGQTKKGRFTQEESDYIKKMMAANEGKRNYITEIAQHLRRPQSSIEKRIKLLQQIHTRKIKWRKRNAAAFIKYLLKVTKIPEENIRELKERHITTKEWEKLSKRLDNVPVRILKRAWLENLYPVLFLPTDSYDLGKAKFKLIKMFYDNNETEWPKVDWSYYASQFEGLTYLRLYSMMKQLIKIHVPADKSHNLKKCLKILNKLKEEDIRKHVIYKIKYKNGEVLDLKPGKSRTK